MKVCNACGDEFDGRDGDNTCQSCEDLSEAAATKERAAARAKRNAARRAREAALRSCGLTKVRGALGGIYWE